MARVSALRLSGRFRISCAIAPSMVRYTGSCVIASPLAPDRLIRSADCRALVAQDPVRDQRIDKGWPIGIAMNDGGRRTIAVVWI
jgi:hypothetical protein